MDTVRSISPTRDLGELRHVSASMSQEASRMLMELEANRAASEQARRVQSPRAGMMGTPMPIVSTPVMRTASPIPRGVQESALKNELAKQIERTHEVEKDRLKSQNDLMVKLTIKDDLLAKLNDELHTLVEKDAAREEAFMKMDVELRRLRDAVSGTNEKLSLAEAELQIKNNQSKHVEEESHGYKMTLSKTQQELERQCKVREKLDEMLSISQRSLIEAQSQAAVKDEVIRGLEDTLRDVDDKNIEIMRALEDKSRTDTVRMEEMARKNDHLQQLVDDLRKELGRLADERQTLDLDYVSQMDRMSYSETTMNERLATSQKTVDCLEAQLAAVKAEQLASAQDAAVRQQELLDEVARLQSIVDEKEEAGSYQQDDKAKIRVLEDKLDTMVLQESTAQERFHNLQAEVEHMRGDADKYRDAHKRALHQLEQERTGHRKSLEEAAQKVRDAERRVQEAEDALHIAKAEKQRLQDVVSSAETDLAILRSQRDGERKRLDDLLTSSQDKLNAVKGSVAEHERRADQAVAEAEALRTEAADLRDGNDRSQQTIIKLRQQIEQVRLQAQQEKNALQDAIDKKTSDYEDAINSKVRYEVQINRLQLEVDSLRADLTKKEEARVRLIEQLEKERDGMRGSIDDALRQGKESSGKLQDEIDSLQRQLNESKRTVRDLHEQLADLKAEKDRQAASYNDELEQLRQANTEKVSELKRQIQRGEAKVQAAEMQCQRLNDQLKDTEDELDGERQRYRQLQDQLDEERASHRKNTSDRVAELRQQIQELQEQVSQKDMDLAGALRKVDVLQLDLERAEKALRNKQTDIDTIEAQHKRDKDNWAVQQTQAEQALHKAQQEISDLKTQLDDALREADKQKALLRAAVSEAEQNDLDKQRRLQQAKDRLNMAEENCSQLQVQILQLKGQLEDAQIETGDALKQAQLKDAELVRWEERLKKYQSAGEQIAALQDANAALEDEMKKLKRENEMLRQELAELQKRWDNSKERNKEDEVAITELRRKNAELQERASELGVQHDGELRKKNQELFAVQQELTEALDKLQSLGRKALDAEETAEWKSKAEGLAEQCSTLQRDLDTCKAPLTAKISELRSEIEKLSQEPRDVAELETLRKEHKEVCEKMRALLEQNNKDQLKIAELEAAVAELEAVNRELEEKGKELEDRGKELSFLLGTRAQLVAQIMSLREAIKNSRQELMKVTREKSFKRAQTTMSMSGGGGTNIKMEKTTVDGVQNTIKKIDTSKKIVEDIVGKYFTGYEKLQHGSSSGHYNVSHDPNAGIFDAESGELGKLAESSPTSTPSRPGFPTGRAPGDSSQFMLASSQLDPSSSPTISPKQSPRLVQRPAQLKGVRKSSSITPSVTPTSVKGSFRK